MVKRFFVLVVAATTMLTLSACESNENPNSDVFQSESTAAYSQESGNEVVSSEPIESNSYTDIVSSSDDASSDDQMMSLETLCSTIKTVLGKNYSGCTVTHDDSTITVSVWIDGLALSLASGDQDTKDSWETAKDSLSELSESIDELVDTAGYNDVNVLFNVLNDLNHENALLSMLNGVVIYDVLETK